MGTEIWLAVVSALLTIIGCLFMLGFRDITRRLVHLESQDSRIIAAVMVLLIAKAGDASAVAEAMHNLINRNLPVT